MANAAGRDALLAYEGWDVQADGLFGAPPITVVVGEHAHSTLVKSLGLLPGVPVSAELRRQPPVGV